MHPLEKQILLSLAIIRTIGNRQKSADEQATRIQKLNRQRMQLLASINTGNETLSNADRARVSLIQFLGRLAERKIRSEI